MPSEHDPAGGPLRSLVEAPMGGGRLGLSPKVLIPPATHFQGLGVWCCQQAGK